MENGGALMEKVINTYYLPADVEREMRIEAATIGVRFPSDFILKMWEQYKQAKEQAGS